MTDLERAYKALSDKQSGYNTLWNYYEGSQPLVYSTKRLREVFNNLSAHFSQNWCAVVVDSVLDRIHLARFTVAGNEPATTLLNEVWEHTGMALDDGDVHKAALVCGEAFVIVWTDEDGGVEAYYNDPRLCHLFYDPDHPKRKQMACKWWVDGDEKRRLTLYYPDRLEYYVSTKKSENVSSAIDFVSADPETAPNPFTEIPVFQIVRERRGIYSELANAIEPQDAINKLLADMMVAAEFGAFRQRYIISSMETKGKLKNAPNEIWDLPAGDGQGQPTQVGEFTETDLSGYLNAIDKLARTLAVITRTPKHYLLDQGGDPSGEALIAMEAPLVKKCSQYIERFGAAWGQVAAFLLRLSGVSVDEATIQPVFDLPETVQPKTQAEIRQLSVAAGLPLRTVLRKSEGWTESELDEMDADKKAETKANQASLGAALLNAQRQFDQGNSRELEPKEKQPNA